MNHVFQRGLQRLKNLSMLTKTNRSMKVLPPHFVVRDPVLELVRKARKEGHVCSLILISIQQFDQLIRQYSAETIRSLTTTLEQVMRETMTEYIDESRLIGVKQLQTNVYGIFVQEPSMYLAQETDALAILIGKSIQMDVNFELQQQDISVQVISAATQLSHAIVDEQLAIYQAVQEAWSAAVGAMTTPYNTLKQQLNNIIQHKEISVLAQPIMNLETGDVFGYEILTRGPLNTIFHAPEHLFEYADRVQLLPDLEFVVIQKAFEEVRLKQIRDQVFINVTAATLSHPYFERNIRRWAAEYGIESCQIIFEITEQHLIRNFEMISKVIHKLRGQGFRLAIDDAGTGYSNLKSILEIIPDIIKLDKSLIQFIDREAAKESLLKAIMAFAQDIQCQVVAEGVEREEEAGVLVKHKVEMGQGYYFARPEQFIADYQQFGLEELKQKIHRLRSVTAS